MDESWQVAFFIRHPDDDRAQRAPGLDFRDSCPVRIQQTLRNVLYAVAAAPPARFRGGGMWEAMHGDMRGWYEVRVRHGRLLYRLYCLLDRDPSTGRGLLVVVDGAAKPVGTAVPPAVYARVRRYGTEYLSRVPRSVI